VNKHDHEHYDLMFSENYYNKNPPVNESPDALRSRFKNSLRMTNKTNNKRKLMKTYSTDSCKLESAAYEEKNVDERMVAE
jgi:hypothetical protein